MAFVSVFVFDLFCFVLVWFWFFKYENDKLVDIYTTLSKFKSSAVYVLVNIERENSL